MPETTAVTPKRYTCCHCGDEFEALRRAFYCSAACKQSAYRNRNNTVVTLRSELTALVEKYQHILQGCEEWIDDVTDPGYRRRSLHDDVTAHAYRALAFKLTGHETNEGCKGIFSHLHNSEREPMLLLILMEVLAGCDRSHGGSVHQLKQKLD